MARKTLVTNLVDFTGGLNLRADAFQLAPNESPDLMNVDVDPRGGFAMRKVVAPFGAAMASAPHSLFSYEKTAGGTEVFAVVGTSVERGSGGAWTAIAQQSTSARCRSVTFKDVCYIQNGVDQPLRWDGTTASRLAQTYNAGDTPNNGDMPIAKCITVWAGSVWVANTLEGGVARPNRVRFSHPNFAEDYRDFEFFDVDTGSDGDFITALVPYGDRLLIFKTKSVYAVYGTDPDNFAVLPVSHEVGTLSQESVVQTDVGLFFFSWPEGVFRYDGRTVTWQFEKLYPAITDGLINDANQSKITLGWGNRRLWVAVPYASATANRVFVLDPTLEKSGAWVQYDLPLGPFFEWRPPAGDVLFLASGVGKARLLKLDQDGVADDFGAGAVHVASWYRTRWADFEQPGILKRWRRPEIVLRGGAESLIRVDEFSDYDPSFSTGHFNLATAATGGVLTWGTGQWGTANWAGNGQKNLVLRGSPFGTARATSLQFNGPTTNVSWGVDSIVFKFRPKPVKA